MPKATLGLPKKQLFEKFHEVMDLFVMRMQDTPFHGGQGPDAVDFKVYSWIQRYSHTFTMKNLLFARAKGINKDDKLLQWYDRMDRMCKNKTTV